MFLLFVFILGIVSSVTRTEMGVATHDDMAGGQVAVQCVFGGTNKKTVGGESPVLCGMGRYLDGFVRE